MEVVIAIMIKMKFLKKSVAFFQAMDANANEAVIINGNSSKAFKVSREIRQGCLISTLLFIIPLEGLSKNLEHAVKRKYLRGVTFQEENLELVHPFIPITPPCSLQTSRKMLSDVRNCSIILARLQL
jgi:hypothetical protein